MRLTAIGLVMMCLGCGSPIVLPNGDPGCGFEAAAFCETFDAPLASSGRARELDPSRWSVSRNRLTDVTSGDNAVSVGIATIPACRAGVPGQVMPDRDTLVCDGVENVESRHLLSAVAEQNYGQISYRIRQPFDFAGRTGRIVFDAEAYSLGGLFGWVSIEITEDPTPVPSFAIFGNDEGGSIPRNAVEVQLQNGCQGWVEGPAISVRSVHVFSGYADTVYSGEPPTCVDTAPGHLNHFELAISQNRIELYATPFSDDGHTFAEPELIYALDVAIPFSRGYVHLTTHNHATLKYSETSDYGATHSIDAWVARWDNIGFDGPVVSVWREHEVPDALEPNGSEMNLAYRVGAMSEARPLPIAGVDPIGATRARLALTAWFDQNSPLEGVALLYRLNAGEWHTHALSGDEIIALTHPILYGIEDPMSGSNGSIGLMLDVPLGDLVSGDNTLEIAGEGYSSGYPMAVYNIDLVLAQ